MKTIKRLKKTIAYEQDTPRCSSCKHYRNPFIFMTMNSNTKKSNPHCKLHEFTISPNAICNTWVSENGFEVLDV